MHPRQLGLLTAALLLVLLGARPGATFARLAPNGVPWAWGSNQYGQLGDGSTADQHAPEQLAGLTGVTAIADGGYHSLALKADGHLLAWGKNDVGQLGDGTTTEQHTPEQLAGPSGVTTIAGGAYHSLALTTDGAVWAWGSNSNGQLGDGTTTDQHAPEQLTGISGVVAIAGGADHSLALTSDGRVWAWGDNGDGELGNGTLVDSGTPAPVSGLRGVVAIASGFHHNLALDASGRVWTWGAAGEGELGDGTFGDHSCSCRSTPVLVSSLGKVVAVAAGGNADSLALKADGTVVAWGSDEEGSLGDGTTGDPSCSCRTTPVAVQNLSGVTAIAGGAGHNLALKADGTVSAWGNNHDGELGNGTAATSGCYCSTTPVAVKNIAGVAAIAAGISHSVALVAPVVALNLQPAVYRFGESSQTGIQLTLNATPPPAGLADFTIDVVYDPTALQVTRCLGAIIGVSSNSICNAHYAADRVRFAYSDSSGLESPSVIGVLLFTVLAPPNSSTWLHIRPVTLADSNVQPLGALVQDLPVFIRAAADVNFDGSVDTYDAACVVRYVAKLPVRPPNCPSLPVYSYDVNQNNKTDATDAFCVLLAVAALPATKDCPAFTLLGAGDAAAAPAGATAARDLAGKPRWGKLRLTPSSATVKPGETVGVDLVAEAPAGLGAWTVDLQYDPKLLTVAGCEAGGAVAACNPAYAPNTIRITGAALGGPSRQVLAHISFTAGGPAGRTSRLTLQAPTLADVAGAALTVQTSGGVIVIRR